MKYDNLGSASASAGKWAELSADISVPEGATDIAIYVQSEYAETTSAKDKISFFLDDVKLESEAVETTAATTTVTTTLAETTTTTAPVTTTITTTSSEEAKSTTSVIEATKKGDVDCNGSVDVSDAVLLARFVAEDSGVTIMATGRKNADIDSESGLQTGDVIMILKAIAKLVTL